MPINRNILNQEGHQIQNFKVHNVAIADINTQPAPAFVGAGSMRYLDATGSGGDEYFSGNLQYHDGLAWYPIHRPFRGTAHGASMPGSTFEEGDTALGIFTAIFYTDGAGGAEAYWDNVTLNGAFLNGVSWRAQGLDTSRDFSITGKVTAAAVGFDGTGNVALNATALSVVAGDIALAGAQGATFLQSNGSGVAEAVAKSGIPLSGFGNPTANISVTGYTITGLPLTPSGATDAASKDYVDQKTAGIAPNTPVRLATAAALATYTAAGSPATLTQQTPYSTLSVDGVTVSNGDRILVKNEAGANEKYNGVYVVTAAGSAGSPWVLDRAAEENSDAEVNTGDEFFVVSGSTNGGTRWALQTPEPITLGTTALTFVQTGGNQAYTAGNGIVAVGNAFHAIRSSAYEVNGVPYANTTSSLTFTGPGGEFKVLRCASGESFPSFGSVDLSTAMVSGTLTVGKGGTGRSSWTAGDLVYASSSNNIAPLAAAASGNVLLSGSAPAWGKVNLSTHVSSQLPVANGGTGRATLTSGAVLYGLGGSEVGLAALGGAGSVLVSSGAAPQFVPISGDLTISAAGLATITNGAVALANIQDINTGVVLGRLSPSSGVPEQLTLSALGSALVSGGHVPRTVELIGDVIGGPTTGTVTTTITALPLSKLANGSARSVVGVTGGVGVHADIASSAGGQVLRVASDNSAVAFGAVDLGAAAAVTGTLPNTRGGTGVSNSGLTFPTVTCKVAGIVSQTMTAGGTIYTLSNPFGTVLVAPTIVDSSGNVIGADILIGETIVTVTFGSVTAQDHTLILVGSDA